MIIHTPTTLLSIWCVLNDVFKQLQEILSFPYFPSFYKFSVYFWMFLMLSSTPNTLFKINTKSKTSLHLLISFYRTITHSNFCVGYFFYSPDLKAHWWAYHMARPLSVCLSVNIFKRLLLQNRWADWSQISCGASMGWGNESLFPGSRSHDQDGRHAHIW